jgi:hypothetical protein
MSARAPGAVVKLTKPRPPEPPRPLGKIGLALWRSVVTRYEFADPGSVEVLYQACAAVQIAADCRAQIERDGLMIDGPNGARAHPLLKDELQNRAFAARAIARLGLDLEPVRSGVGRPPGMSFA